jgi:DNA invertase Pin-like site-specific DNA recombinase
MKRTNRTRRNPSDAPRLVGYSRVSLTEQADKGVSLAAQRDRLDAHAKASGYTLVEVVEDRGVSGTLHPHRRPGLVAALDAVRTGRADGIVVVKLDRLSRSTRDTLDLIERADREGWSLVSVSESLDTRTAVGRFVVGVLAGLAQMERDRLAERTTEAMGRVAREGRLRSRFVPFGHALAGTDATDGSDTDARQLVEDEAEQTILVRMLALREEGKGAVRIAGTLARENVRNPRTGGAWSAGTVAAILRTHDRRADALAVV